MAAMANPNTRPPVRSQSHSTPTRPQPRAAGSRGSDPSDAPALAAEETEERSVKNWENDAFNEGRDSEYHGKSWEYHQQ